MMTTIKIGNKEIKLNSDLLRFDEHTINQFLQEFAANYNTYAEAHSDAQYVFSKFEDKYEALYADKFRQYRDESSSDKAADMKTKCDKEVQEALENVRIAKRNVNLLWGFLRSMDRSHEDAMNFCYNLRKELTALFPNYVKTNDNYTKRLEEVIKPYDERKNTQNILE